MQVQTFIYLSRRALATLSAADRELTVDEVAERTGLTNKCARDVLRGLRTTGQATSTKNDAGINHWRAAIMGDYEQDLRLVS